MRLVVPTVELSQLSNEVYAIAGYALVAELSSHEVSKLSMVVCTFSILGNFPKVTTPQTPQWLNEITLLCELSQR